MFLYCRESHHTTLLPPGADEMLGVVWIFRRSKANVFVPPTLHTGVLCPVVWS